jgi:hypothetical protein
MLQATLPAAGERPLAPATSVAVKDNSRVTGVLAQKDSTVYAEFEIENTGKTDAQADFHYSAQFTPGMSTMSRMMPVPREATNGHCVVTVPAGSRRTERFVVQQRPAVAPAVARATSEATAPDADPRPSEAADPDHWTLLVSRGEIAKAHGWGGVLPSAAFATNRLDKGTLVLASSPAPSRPQIAKGR